MGRPPKNSGAKVTSQVIDEADKNVNLNVVSKDAYEATVDVEKEQLKAQLAEQQQKMDELMAQMKLMMQAQANKPVHETAQTKPTKRNIKFINMTAGGFTIRGTRMYHLEKQFDYKLLSETEAKVVVNNMPKSVSSGLLYIADHDFVEECELGDVYADLLSNVDLEKLLSRNAADVCEIYRNANDEQKEIIINMISGRLINGQPVDANILMQLGKLCGKDLINIEQMED